MLKILLASMFIIMLTISRVPTHAQVNQTDYIWRIEWSPENDKIAVIQVVGDRLGNDENILIYDAQTAQQLGVIPNTPRLYQAVSIQAIAWNSEGTHLAIARSVSGQPLIEVWDISAFPYQLITEYQTNIQASGIGTGLAWRPNSMEIAFSNRESIELIDATTGNLIRIFGDSQRSFTTNNLSWNPDGSQLLGGELPGRLWDVNSSEPIARLQTDYYFTPTIWSPDGTRFLTQYDSSIPEYSDSIRIWDATTLQPIGLLETGIFNFPRSVDWKGNIIGVIDQTTSEALIKLWDADSFELLTTISSPETIWDFAFSPDGTQIAYASGDSTLMIVEIVDLLSVDLDDLHEKVDECVTDNGINNSLHAKINSGQLNAFINEVEAQRGKKITEECADELIDMANRLIEQESEE